jgi:dienelactone hydrolase
MARIGMDLDGVASFHGNLGAITPATRGAVKAKLLVLNGADDPFVPKEQLEGFKKEMDGAGVSYELISYPGAKHAFTNPGATEKGEKFGLPLAYNEEADKKSWAELEKFLAEIYGSSK